MDNVRRINPRDMADPDGLSREAANALEAEFTVLGGCIQYPRTIPEVAGVITGPDFYRPAHETVWNALLHLYKNGQPTEPVALALELDRRGDLKRIGGADYLHNLAQWAMADPAYYAAEVRKKADLRAAAELGRRIVQRAEADDAEPGETVTFIDDYLKRQQERAAGRSGDPVDALLAELLDTSSLDNMPALEPLVGDLLHLDSLARIVGPSGHMKSFVTIDFAGHVGTGMKWHGHYVRQGTVVYLVAEGARGIRKRVRAWEQHYGLRMDNVLFLPRPVQAMSPEWDTLIEAMRRLAPSLIVIDTQARVSVGVEENSAKELGLVVDRMEQLRAATAACVLVIHHTGHVGEHGRGSSSAKGALQSEMHVSKKGDSAKNIVVTMKVGKQKDDEQGGDLQFGLKVVTLHGEAKPDGSPVTSVILESLDQRPDHPPIGSPQWLVRRLDAAGMPITAGSPRVIKWCAENGIQMRKDKIEEAIRIRKRRDSFEEAQTGTGDGNPVTHNGSDQNSSDIDPDPLSDCARNDLPPNLPHSTFNQTPPDLGGRSGEVAQNPRSNIPPNAGGGRGEAPSKPPSPRSPSREGGGEGEVGENTTPDTPTEPPCTVCGEPLHGYRLERGYDTCLSCDPTTGSHPDTPPTPGSPTNRA
ncbi:AAA family ATPase [Streptomyces malaysiensis]|uniref:AAA family ATPase n=1 Tax=Streptomyces malaysiensis TaxID=92644 RepID=UPI00322051A2|nr:AAA family ATPase [Streptomyces malaysiensis]